MKKISFKKTLAAGLMAAMVTSAPLAADAKTERLDTIYGPILCESARTEISAGNGYFLATTTAYTNTNWAYLQTTLEIQITTTGTTVFQQSGRHTHTADDANATSVAPAVMYRTGTASGYTAFSAHEVVGDVSYVKYLAVVY